MVHTWPVLLLIYVVVLQICAECQDCCSSSANCCESTNCYETNSCCQHNNCCQQTNCCRTTNCQRSTCYRLCDSGCRSQSCATQCRQRCPQYERCDTPSTSTTSTNPTTPTPWIPTQYTPSPTPAKIKENGDSTNINNGSVQATISLTNNITNVNTIDIPVSITNENYVSINVIPIPATVGPVIPTSNVPVTPFTFPSVSTEPPSIQSTGTESTGSKPTSTECTSTSPCSTTPQDLVPVPVPVYIPVYRTIPYPIYVGQQQGCCRVFSPCISSQTGNNCDPYRTMCGAQCTHPNMFAVMNPCQNGCYKKPYAPVRSCTVFGYCQVIMKNCDSCRDDFYTNYNSYQNCGGCFYS